MKQYDSDIILAKEKARQAFNSLSYDTRKTLANGYERLCEIELLLGKGDSLSVATIKKRKKELEGWLIEWYNENKHGITTEEKNISERRIVNEYWADGEWHYEYK